MKISIITASYNYEEHIKDTIESVLAQTYPEWELVIVDDGSGDSSVEVIKSYSKKDPRVKLYRHENGINRGLVETIKLGLKNAENEWIVFLESDDLITPDYLEKKVEIAKAHSEVNFIFNDVEMFGDSEVIESYSPHIEAIRSISSSRKQPYNALEELRKRNIVATFSVVMAKKEEILKCDFDTPVKPLLDLYLWAQLVRENDFYFIDEKMTKWRMHKESYIFDTNNEPPVNVLKFDLKIGEFIHKSPVRRFFHTAKSFIKFTCSQMLKMKRDIIRVSFKRGEVCFLGTWYGAKT